MTGLQKKEQTMRHALLISMASVLCAGLLAGCSNEVHNPEQRDVCLTDGFTSWGQDVYYGRYIPCFMDGHEVAVTPPRQRVDSTSVTTTSVSTSGSASVTVSGTAGH